MNISYQTAGNLLSGFRTLFGTGRSKSVEQSQERRQKCESQVAFFEKQKENLKNVACGSVEEIAEKLKSFHSYEDQIATVKAAYNQEQMFHILDESTERGEKIAEAVEKMEPKTPEERLEEMAEEALGVEDGGELEEAMEELEEVVEELTEETVEKLEEALPEDAELSGNADLSVDEAAKAAAAAEAAGKEATAAEEFPEGYIPFDIRL